MLRILVVEDEQNKKQLLTQVVVDANAEAAAGIQYADNVKDAKRLLAQYRYDLVILDINIPMTPAGSPEVGAGISILHFIQNNQKAISPRYIFGLTAYEDGFVAGVDAFESAL